MSQILLSRYPDGSTHVMVGYDHPANGVFWQEWANKSERREAELLMKKAERTGVGPHSQTVLVYETGIKREGGMWPGIPLGEFRESMPEDLRHLITNQVMELLTQHMIDPDSGYVGSSNRGFTDLSTRQQEQ
jgi:hypothetical protein